MEAAEIADEMRGEVVVNDTLGRTFEQHNEMVKKDDKPKLFGVGI